MKVIKRREKTEKENSVKVEATEMIRYKEERIKALLNPVESYILLLQRILVWDLPYASAILYIAVHILFWLSTTIRIYCLFGITCMVLVAVDLGILHVLASMDGRDGPDGGYQNSWTDVHPNFLGVPEISRYLAKIWVNGLGLLDSAIAMRACNHPKFFVSSIVYLGVLAFFGTYIPGVYLAYVIVMGLLLLPCLKYHRILDRVETVALPFMSHVEQKLNIKRKRRRRSKKGSQTQQAADLDDEQSSDEQTLNEFVPPMNSVVMTTLTSALSREMAWDDEEDDDLLTGHTPSGRQTPQMPSFTQWRDQSDDEILGDDLSSLTQGLGTEMPSINDVDGTILGGFSMELEEAIVENILSGDRSNSAAFSLKSPHSGSGESDSDADVESLATGLCFSDADSVDVTGTGLAPVFGASGTLLNDILTQGHSTLTAALSSSTISGIVSGASLGIGALRDAVKRGALAASSSVEEAVTDSDVLDAEFEFLDREELDQAAEQ